ncbi:MAG: hypothetical protein ACK52I_25560, partial [Pseudomonadota bacterium]
VSIKDASGNIIDSGAFAFSQDVSALTTSWAQYRLTLRAPRNVPADAYFHLESTTTIATAAVYIDEIVFAELTPIGSGGQAVGLLSGSTDWKVDDVGRFTFTNNNEGAFVRGFDRLFDMYGKGLSLPQNYSNTETISDTLIA